MGIVKNLVGALKNFAEIPTTATARTMKLNPVAKSIEGLIKNPQYKNIGTFKYVAFGQRDDIDEVLEILKSKSSTHSGIINRKSKMVAGDRLETGGKNGNKKTAWSVFEKRAGGKVGATLEAEWKKMANIYETYGAVGILRTTKGNDLVSLKALSPRKMRIAELDSKNEITHFIVRPTFASGSGQLYRNTERKVELYNPEMKQKESILYIKNPATENDFYGMPNYIGAYNFIEADYNFGVTIHNAAENGFQPKVMATFIGRNMSTQEKETHATSYKDNFHGSDKELAIVNYVRRIEEMPQIDKLDIQNLDKTISTMANLNDAKILTAHSVTNPSLFGVQVAGKLGNSGTELESAYNIFRATETLPNRALIMDGLMLCFLNTSFYGIELEVIDEPVTPQENRGDNVEADDTKKKTKKGDTKKDVKKDNDDE